MVCLRLLTHTLMAFENLDTVHPSWRAPYFASLLREGAVVACPAEGVWGLSCDPNNETAVFDVLAMKDRSASKGLIVVADRPEVFGCLLEGLPVDQRDAIEASWPGPSTWLVPNRNVFPDWITGDSDEVAIRVTSAPALSAVCRTFGGALVSTSANPTGLAPPHALWEVRRYFGLALPAMPGFIDPKGKPSTIRRASDGMVIRA